MMKWVFPLMAMAFCTAALADQDFNPLPDAESYVFRKEGVKTTSGYSWRCTTVVHRTLLDPQPSSPGNKRFFQDSNAVRCTFSGQREAGKPEWDTLLIETRYLDTVAFWESADSLFMDGFNDFDRVHLPAGFATTAVSESLRSTVANGFSAPASVVIKTNPAAFPKRQFPSSAATVAECRYVESGTSTPCKRMLWTDNLYGSETIDFLEGVGLLVKLGQAVTGQPGDGISSKIQLLNWSKAGDTTAYPGTVQIGTVGLRRPLLRPGSGDIRIGDPGFDARGRAVPARRVSRPPPIRIF